MNGIMNEIIGIMGATGTPKREDWTTTEGGTTFTELTKSLWWVGQAVTILGGMALLIWSVPKVVSYIMGGGHGQTSMPWIVAALVAGALMVFGAGFSLITGLANTAAGGGTGAVIPLVLGL